MPTVNATIVRITSIISSMCFFIKKKGGEVINQNGSIDENKGNQTPPSIINI